MKFLDQSNRILKVAIVREEELSAKLVIERFAGSDHLSRDFHYEVLLLSEDGRISLSDIQGRMMVVSLRLPDGGWRPFTGLVKYFERIDGDMRGIHSYRAALVPWTDYARLRRNCRVYLDATREQQCETIFRPYLPDARWRWLVTGEQGRHTMCLQFNETDRNYVDYRLEVDGTPYRFEHDEEGHTLIVFDTTREADPIRGTRQEPRPEVCFQPDHSPSTQPYAITQWRQHSQWGHARQRLSSYDFKQARPTDTWVPTVDHKKNVAQVEDHEFVGNHGYTSLQDGQRLATLRMEESEVRRQQIEGRSTNPFLQPGRWFELTDHPDCARDRTANEYVVSEVHYEAKNNFLLEPGEAPSVTNTFLCHPRKVPWRPGRGWASTPNVVNTVQTATVVGMRLGGSAGAVDVDEFGRVLVRFHWDLEGAQTCRVRVQSPWAGGENGFAFYPRIGSEVTIVFEMGNPDSPIVQGSLSNALRRPAWQLPAQSHVSGMRSRENTPKGGNLPGKDGNHMLFDDTPGKLHWQAFSSHQYSQVGLGWISYFDGSTGRTRPRGQGLEARTDGHAAIRAALGLLQTTDARGDAVGHVTDIREAAERLGNAQDLHASLAEAARAAGAHDANDQSTVVQALTKQNTELKGSGGSPETGRFPEFQAPHILTSSSAGIESTAEGSTHLASNEHIALTSGGHTSLGTGKNLLASVKGAFRLFVYKAGMKLVSASADIDMQALKTSINLLAKLNITQRADCIDLNAATRLSLSGGGSNITLSASGITHKTTGQWLAHAARFEMTGPASVGTPALPQAAALPLGQLDLLHRYVSQAIGRAARGAKQGGFAVVDAEGSSHTGALDDDGSWNVASVPMGMAEVGFERDPSDPWADGSYLGEDKWPGQAPATQAATDGHDVMPQATPPLRGAREEAVGTASSADATSVDLSGASPVAEIPHVPKAAPVDGAAKLFAPLLAPTISYWQARYSPRVEPPALVLLPRPLLDIVS